MTMTTERIPRLVVPMRDPGSRYLLVLCTGVRKNGRDCSRSIGYLNINHPHDVQFICHDCGLRYELQKP